MCAYHSFAVIGAGTIGLPIVAALASTNASVVLLTRPDSAKKILPEGVSVAKVDYKDALAIAAVLEQHKVDVVLSTIGTAGSASQETFVEAARVAQVKLFAPSEYGFQSDGVTGVTEGHHGEKKQIADLLKTVGIPSVRFYTGLFIEWLPWLVGYDPKQGKFNIVGSGETSMSLTSIEDIAGFVAYVLTTLPPSELENRTLRLEGERASLKELASEFKAQVKYEGHIQGDSGDFKSYLFGLIDSGAGSTGWNGVTKTEGAGSEAAGSANMLWPGHQWKTVRVVHNL